MRRIFHLSSWKWARKACSRSFFSFARTGAVRCVCRFHQGMRCDQVLSGTRPTERRRAEWNVREHSGEYACGTGRMKQQVNLGFKKTQFWLSKWHVHLQGHIFIGDDQRHLPFQATCFFRKSFYVQTDGISLSNCSKFNNIFTVSRILFRKKRRLLNKANG